MGTVVSWLLQQGETICKKCWVGFLVASAEGME